MIYTLKGIKIGNLLLPVYSIRIYSKYIVYAYIAKLRLKSHIQVAYEQFCMPVAYNRTPLAYI